ncbi:MAG: leucyl aminopeptidase family protein [Thermoanaerobaculia bacterium]
MSGIVPASIVSPRAVSADLLVVGVPEQAPVPAAEWPQEVAEALSSLAGRPGFRGAEHQAVETSLGAAGPLAAVGLQGMGSAAELDAAQVEGWIWSVVDAARSSGVSRLALALPDHALCCGPEAAERVIRQASVAPYRFDRLRKANGNKGEIREISLIPPPGQEKHYRAALEAAHETAAGVELARDLTNSPPNEATPAWIEEQAREIARARGFSLTVLGQEQLEQRGMGGLLAVGRGSHFPPRLIRLEWGDEGPIVALVGKGITFDSGGLSLKNAASMETMKFDKGGACSALAAAAVAARMGLSLRLRVYLALAENMPDGAACRPGDIIRCYNGKTVEVLNTDCEGRLILADALALAVEEGAERLLELSTLTGHCAVALGQSAGGLFTPDDSLASELLDAAQASGERLWRLPLWREHVDQMKGQYADLRNNANQWGGASTAAAFLSQFVSPLRRWAHIDMAGPVHREDESRTSPGATGFGVPLASLWLRRQAQG